jgi:hypothetical protein
MFPIIGKYSISEVAKISYMLHKNYGEICKLDSLIGRPDMLFVFNADEIEKCYREADPVPFRPSMPRYFDSLEKENFDSFNGKFHDQI